MRSATQQEWAAMSEQERDRYRDRLARHDRLIRLRDQWIFPAIKYCLILCAGYFMLIGIETAVPQWLIDLNDAWVRILGWP